MLSNFFAFLGRLIDVRRHHADAVTFATMARDAVSIYVGISGTVLFFFMLLATLLNYSGYMVVNAYIYPLVVAAFYIMASWPSVLVNAYLGNVALRKLDASAAVDNPAQKWAQVFTSGVFYLSIFYLFASTFPFRRNFSLVFILSIALIVLLYCGYKWDMSPKFGKTFVFWYAVATALVCALGMLSPTVHYKFVGTDLFAIFHVRASDETLIEIDEAQTRNAEQVRQKELRRILSKVEAKQDITDKEKKFLEDERERRKNGSALNTLIVEPAKKIPGLFSNNGGNGNGGQTYYREYGIGEYEFAVNPGVRSHIVKIPHGFHYSIDSKDPKRDWVAIFKDGSVRDGKQKTWPSTYDAEFIIEAYSPHVMTLKVWKK